MTNNNESNTDRDQAFDDSKKTVILPKKNSSDDEKTRLKPQKNHQFEHTENNRVEQNTTLIQNNEQHKTKPHGTGSLLKNRFDLLEIIGSGGMGTVYKSLDRRDVEAGNSTFIAIKVINDEYKNDSDLLKALHSEARKTQALAHPNIVTVYDFDRDEDTVFMTMEFIDGVPLDKMIKANPHGMPPSKALKIISKMSQALIYAHSKSIIHLDFKPNNVFVDLENHVKVFDFGIARVANIALSRGFDASVLGGLTPSYASLEMFKNETPDPRDDLYALACVSYELLSGHHPFNQKSADIALQKHLKPKKIKSLNAKQWSTLKQALAFKRNDRVKDVATFLQGMTARSSTPPYITLAVALVSIGVIALSLKFFPFELTTSIFSTQQDPDIVTPVNKTVVSKKTLTPSPPLNQQPPLESKPAEIIKELGNINIQTEKNNYQIGESLQFSFTVDRPMYIKVVTINSQGKLIALFPNPYQTANYCKPNTVYQVPPKNAEFTLDIGGPSGVDKIIAIGSSNPISATALQFNSAGEILDPKLRKSLIYKSISYTIKE